MNTGHLRSYAIAVCQPITIPGDVRANVRQIIEMTQGVSREGAKFACFSEAALTGYDYSRRGVEVALSAEDPVLEDLSKVAAETAVCIIAGFFEIQNGTLRNTAAAFLPDGRIELQRKRRVIDPEASICGTQPVEQNTQIFFWDGIHFSILICSDTGIPGIYSELSRRGCDLVFALTAGAGSCDFGVHESELSNPGTLSKITEQATRIVDRGALEQAISLGIACVSCNQAGWEPAMNYFHPGGSSILSAMGRIEAIIPPRFVFEHLRPEWAVGAVNQKPKSRTHIT